MVTQELREPADDGPCPRKAPTLVPREREQEEPRMARVQVQCAGINSPAGKEDRELRHHG